MNLYLVERTDDTHHDEYLCFLVASKTKALARSYNPNEYSVVDTDRQIQPNKNYHAWVNYEKLDSLKVTYVGVAGNQYSEGDIIISSFDAG